LLTAKPAGRVLRVGPFTAVVNTLAVVNGSVGAAGAPPTPNPWMISRAKSGVSGRGASVVAQTGKAPAATSGTQAPKLIEAVPVSSPASTAWSTPWVAVIGTAVDRSMLKYCEPSQQAAGKTSKRVVAVADGVAEGMVVYSSAPTYTIYVVPAVLGGLAAALISWGLLTGSGH
jgi:hypothetical protein